jgi:hypothetical protein
MTEPSIRPSETRGAPPRAGYIHGFGAEEQDRLYAQARFLEPWVFRDVRIEGARPGPPRPPDRRGARPPHLRGRDGAPARGRLARRGVHLLAPRARPAPRRRPPRGGAHPRAGRASFIDYWIGLVRSAAPELRASGDPEAALLDDALAELRRVRDASDGAFFYAFLEARARR